MRQTVEKGVKKMNKTLRMKISGMLVTVMLGLALLPVVAFAAGPIVHFKDIVYKADGTVTGTVYTDEYPGNETLPLRAYFVRTDDSQVRIGVTSSVYTITNGVYEYHFQTSLADTIYNRFFLYYSRDSISETVYRQVPPPVTPPDDDDDLPVVVPETPPTNTIVNGVVAMGNQIPAEALTNGYEDRDAVDIATKEEFVSLEVAGLVEPASRPGASIIISNDYGTYELPLHLLDFASMAEQLGVDIADLNLVISMKKVDGEHAESLSRAIDKLGAEGIADAVDFIIAFEADGKTVELNDFGFEYVKRTMKLNQAPSKTATVVCYDPASGELSFVPSIVEGDGATFMRPGNSYYTVVQFDKPFTDIGAHWARDDIELLANKLVVSGKTGSRFDADGNLTRAEFVATVVGALGLNVSNSDTASFNDVRPNTAYAAEIHTAVQAGLIAGHKDGSFRPDAPITREELVAIVSRVLAFVGKDVDLTPAQQLALLRPFADGDTIAWAKAEFAELIHEGIVSGNANSTLAPSRAATRAEAAAVLKRLLSKIGFIE